MRLWPDVLPTPSMPGFGLSPLDPVLRTDMEGGTKRRRRTSFARQDIVDMAWRFTDTEMAAFRAWWNDEAWSIAGDSESLAAWTFAGASRAAGAVLSPDGVIVDNLIENTATSSHYVTRTLPAAVDGQTILCRATLKSAGRQWVGLLFYDRAGVAHFTMVDLTNGVFGAQSGLTSASLQNRGNGWWRVTITAPAGTGVATPIMRIQLATSNALGSYIGNGVSGVSVAEIGARAVTGYDLHLRTDAAGNALGAAGGAGWVQVPIAVGGGFKTVEACFTGPFKATAGAGLNWDVMAQMEARNA